ncbi:MAG: hypothetical protein ACK5UE_05545 [Chitinophagales bacterium]|jgi:hypothetical protein|nr:hypothetical protein [Sphingobacteriales bacterium]
MIKKWFDKLLGKYEDLNLDTDKDRLADTFDQLARYKAEDRAIGFKIIESRQSGFIVKVEGLYAFVAYLKMPWFYADIKKWHTIAPYMIDCKMGGKIQRMSYEDNLYVTIDASDTVLKTATFQIHKAYRCIVLWKNNQSVLVELGQNFDWKCGSIEAEVKKSSFYFLEEFKDLNIGDSFVTFFHGFETEGKMIFGHQWVDKELENGELEKLIGSVQPITIHKESRHKYTYWYRGQYQCQLSITEDIYGDSYPLDILEQYLNNLADNSTILCEFIAIGKLKYKIKLKLADQLCQAIYDIHIQKNKKQIVEIADKLNSKSKPAPKPIVVNRKDEKVQYLHTIQEFTVKIDENGVKTYWLDDNYNGIPHLMFKEIKSDQPLKKKLRKLINLAVNGDKLWFYISDKLGKKNILYIQQTIESANKNLTDWPINKEKNKVEIKKAIVSDRISESMADELDSIMDTEQDIAIRYDADGKRRYWFQNYECKKIRFFENYLENVKYINPVKRYLQGLSDCSTIRCVITGIDTRKNKLHIKLSNMYKEAPHQSMILDTEKERFIGKEELIDIRYENNLPIFYLKNQWKCRFPRSYSAVPNNKGKIMKYIELNNPFWMTCIITGRDRHSEEYILELTKEQQEEIIKSIIE